MLKKPTMKQKGLKKLPEEVRNKMGFMDEGGPVKNNKSSGRTMSDKDTKNFAGKDIVGMRSSGRTMSDKNMRSSGRTMSDADKRSFLVDKGTGANTISALTLEQVDKAYNKAKKEAEKKQDGGRVGAADMSAKKTSSPKKKQMPQYYMGGGMAKKSKMYSYGGRVAKYKD